MEYIIVVYIYSHYESFFIYNEYINQPIIFLLVNGIKLYSGIKMQNLLVIMSINPNTAQQRNYIVNDINDSVSNYEQFVIVIYTIYVLYTSVNWLHFFYFKNFIPATIENR